MIVSFFYILKYQFYLEQKPVKRSVKTNDLNKQNKIHKKSPKLTPPPKKKQIKILPSKSTKPISYFLEQSFDL